MTDGIIMMAIIGFLLGILLSIFITKLHLSLIIGLLSAIIFALVASIQLETLDHKPNEQTHVLKQESKKQ